MLIKVAVDYWVLPHKVMWAPVQLGESNASDNEVENMNNEDLMAELHFGRKFSSFKEIKNLLHGQFESI